MTGDEVKRHIWRNTISNYVCVAVRLLMGVALFRLLTAELPDEEFGFWLLLWSVFGYGILLDFGFGFTVQKRTAELSIHRDWTELSKVLSTIFFVYLGLGGVIFLVGALGSSFFIDVFKVSPANREHFEHVLMLFLCGLGIAFPVGLFPEILRGLHRIALANYVLLGGMTVNFVLTAVALFRDWGLATLVIIALSCTLLPDLVSGWIALRRLPEVRIRPRFFSRAMVRKTMSFSMVAYIVTVSNLILTKTDNLVIGTVLGVSTIAIYGTGAKVCEMFFALTQQLPETLSPAAAHHHAGKDRASLRELLIDGTRFCLMISTPLYCLCALLMDPILWVIVDDPDLRGPQTFWTAQILLLWVYMMVVTQSVSKRIFMMCGHERRLMWLSLGEAALNLGLSVAWIMMFRGVWAVALASLTATTFFGWAFLWPWSAREAGLSGWKLARLVLIPTWMASLPLLAAAALVWSVPALQLELSLPLVLVEGAVAFLLAAFGVWRLGLTGGEREKLIQRFRLRRKPA